MTPTRWLLAILACVLSTLPVETYVLSGHKWAITSPVYYVNPTNAQLTQTDVLAAVQLAATAWADQAGISVRPTFGGLTNRTGIAQDGQSTISFQAGAADRVAFTWAWYANNAYTESDTVIYEDVYPLFVGTGCVGGIYLEDVLIHEFGHFLGLNHTDVPGATMQPNLPSYCDVTQLTLEADDIAGARALYPISNGGTTTTIPPTTTTIPPAIPYVLTARGYKVKGLQRVDLTWSGFISPTLDVYRDDVRINTVPNSTLWTDPINRRGGGTYRYRLCEVLTASCSATVTVTF